MSHRYRLRWGNVSRRRKGYLVWDSVEERVVFKNPDKTEAIAKAQSLNGFDVVDGLQKTYYLQTTNLRDAISSVWRGFA